MTSSKLIRRVAAGGVVLVLLGLLGGPPAYADHDWNLSVSMTASPTGEVSPGDEIIYSIAVMSGTDVIPPITDEITLTDTIPAGTTFVSLAGAESGKCTTPSVGGTGNVTCTDIGQATLTLIVEVDTTAPGWITNTATVTTFGDGHVIIGSATVVNPEPVRTFDETAVSNGTAMRVTGTVNCEPGMRYRSELIASQGGESLLLGERVTETLGTITGRCTGEEQSFRTTLRELRYPQNPPFEDGTVFLSADIQIGNPETREIAVSFRTGEQEAELDVRG